MRNKLVLALTFLLIISALPSTSLGDENECPDCGWFAGLCDAACDALIDLGTPSTGNPLLDYLIDKILDEWGKTGTFPPYNICCELCCSLMESQFGGVAKCAEAKRALEECIAKYGEGNLMPCCPIWVIHYDRCGGTPPDPSCLTPTPTPTATPTPAATPTPSPSPTASPTPTPEPTPTSEPKQEP
jgi:hypothetical protein